MFEMIMLLIIFIGVLVLTYFATRKIADLRQSGVTKKNLQIIEALPFVAGQYLYIVKIGQKYHLFAGTKERLNHCFEINQEELDFSQIDKIPFEEYMKKFMKAKEEKENEKN